MKKNNQNNMSFLRPSLTPDEMKRELRTITIAFIIVLIFGFYHFHSPISEGLQVSSDDETEENTEELSITESVDRKSVV